MDQGKIFYTIADVAEKVGVEKYVIRFWETEFHQINPDRKSGRRYYRQVDIEIILNIKDLLYKKGFTIKGAKKFLAEKKSLQSDKIFSDFKMDEVKGELKPIPEQKILTRFSFEPPKDDEWKNDIKKAIIKLGEIEDILKE